MTVRFRVTLPDEAIEAIQDGIDFRGKAQITLTFPKAKGGPKLKRLKPIPVLETYQLRIIEHWNASPQVSFDRPDGRNQPITETRWADLLRPLGKALELGGGGEQGAIPILESMGAYFECCTNNGHIHDGINYAFKDLVAFLVRYHQYTARGRARWWEEQNRGKIFDPHPELTIHIANAFARHFLGVKTFTLENPSRCYSQFLRTADRVLEWGQRGIEIPPDQLIEWLMGAVRDSYHGIVHPHNLCAAATWEVILPQYLNHKIPGGFHWPTKKT